MAATLREVISEMKTILRSEASPAARRDRILELVAGFLVKALARDEDRGQVAVLMAIPEARQLTFAYPPHLARGNVLPIDRDSFAGRVVLEKRPLVENQVPDEPHKDFFERIPARGREVRPIQKMIAAPLLGGDGEAIGVIEVSRTGASPSEAGADFTPVDARNLEKCCRAFAPFVARTWTRAE
jgi:hypothetical protein